MIKIAKGPPPQVLLDHEAQWTVSLKTKLAAQIIPTDAELSRYRHPQIKAALIAETHGKCAYCESKLTHIAYGDVEHVVPKSVDPSGRFKWENLTIACDRCNTNKGDNEGFVDPNADEPKEHFIFQGPMVLPLPHSDKALATERGLKLNRPELVDRRSERIRRLHDLALLATNAATPALRDILWRDLLENETVETSEYLAATFSYIDTLRDHGIVN
jgi:uncharacterized protein (TIGR02646 family)